MSAVEGTDGRNSEGFVEGIDAKVMEGGGVRRKGLVCIVDQNFDESQREDSLECLNDALGIGTVYSYGENLRLLFPRYFVCESRQPPCT